MTLPTTTSGTKYLNDLLKLTKEFDYYAKGTKQIAESRLLKSQFRAISNRLDKASNVAKEATNKISKVKQVTDALQKGAFKQINPNLGAWMGVGTGILSLGLTTFLIKKQEEIQELEIKNDAIKQINSNIEFNIAQKAFTNTRSLEKRFSALEKNYKDTKDRLYAESGSAIKNSVRAETLANEALYETRAARTKLETLYNGLRKMANDALYEVRAGRQILGKQIQEAQKLGTDALFETRKNTQRQDNLINQLQTQIKQVIGTASTGASQSISQTLKNVQQEIATFKQQQVKTEQRLSFQEKVAETLQNGVRLLHTQPPTWGLQIKEFAAKTSKELLEVRDDFTRIFKPQLAEVRKAWYTTSERVDRLEKQQTQQTTQQQQQQQQINSLDRSFEQSGRDFYNQIEQQRRELAETKKVVLSAPKITDEFGTIKKDIDGLKTDINKQKIDLDKLGKQIKEREDMDKRANDKLDNLDKKLTNVIPTILGIPLVVGRAADRLSNQMPTIPQIESAAQTGACRSLNGGCSGGNPLNNLKNDINQNTNNSINNILDGLNTGANAAQLAALQDIQSRLGPQLPGGISTFLQNFLTRFNKVAEWLHLDRVLNVLIWWQTLHNAYMLSANLGQTLTSAVSNVLAAIGIKDAEGQPLDIGAIVGKTLDDAAKTALGEETWGGIKSEWKRYNRIYQAAANILSSIQSITQSILSALEVVGSWVGSIGNALKNWGQVGERAYSWMNPNINFQNNRFFRALETAENVVSQIDQVASEVLSVQQTIQEIGEQNTELQKSLQQTDDSKQKPTPPEATKVKAAADESKLVSATGLAITDNDMEADE